MALRVTLTATMRGDTLRANPLSPLTIVLMSPRQWLQRALSALHVGGRPRADLNILLDRAKRGVVGREAAARIIERDIMDARRRATATKAELMARFAMAGRPYGLSVPRASTLWP